MRWPAARILAVVLLATAAALAPGLAAASAAPGDTSPAEVRFTQPAWSVDEGAGYAVISVERTGLPVSAIDVDYSTAAGTATAGVDYTDAHGTLHFAVGTTVASFAVNVVDDSVPETTETVTLRLDAVRGEGRPGSPASLLIRDDDTRTGAAATAPTAPPTGASSRSAARPAPETATGPATATPNGGGVVVARRRSTAPAIAPAPVRPPTRFELRTRADDDSITDGSLGGTRVNPLLAILAGLLVARLSAEVWFRVRTLAS